MRTGNTNNNPRFFRVDYKTIADILNSDKSKEDQDKLLIGNILSYGFYSSAFQDTEYYDYAKALDAEQQKKNNKNVGTETVWRGGMRGGSVEWDSTADPRYIAIKADKVQKGPEYGAIKNTAHLLDTIMKSPHYRSQQDYLAPMLSFTRFYADEGMPPAGTVHPKSKIDNHYAFTRKTFEFAKMALQQMYRDSGFVKDVRDAMARNRSRAWRHEGEFIDGVLIPAVLAGKDDEVLPKPVWKYFVPA
jgi:hypothetical protein